MFQASAILMIFFLDQDEMNFQFSNKNRKDNQILRFDDFIYQNAYFFLFFIIKKK